MNPTPDYTKSLGSVEPPEVRGYGKMKLDVASHLDQHDVIRLMTLFEFSRADSSTIMRDELPHLRFIEKLDMLGFISPTDITRLLSALKKVGLSGVCAKVEQSFDDFTTKWLNYRERVEVDSRKKRFLVFLQQLGLENKKPVSLIKAMEIKKCHVDGEGHADTLDTFISKITCYDHRIYQRRNLGRGAMYSDHSTLDTRDWADFDSDDSESSENSEGNDFSSRDILYAILSCLDPFLLQDVFTKMSACQLAVPVLMPNVMDNCVDFRLWCLRKISKSWFDHKKASIQTESIASYSVLTVTALRFGEVNLSKSNVLNKLLGISQGNDEHAFFNCSEQDSIQSHWSQGTLECVWYLPDNDVQTASNREESFSENARLTEVLSLLNLRGNANDFEAQTTFAVQNSFATIIFIDSKKKQHYKEKIDTIRKISHVILVISSSDRLKRNKEAKVVKHDKSITTISVFGQTAVDIGDLLAENLRQLIIENDTNHSFRKKCFDQSFELCAKLGIRVDENVPECMEAKKRAEEIMTLIKTLDNKKERIFPVQGCRNMVIPQLVEHEENENVESITEVDIETQIAKECEINSAMRKRQLETPLSEPVKKLYDSLSIELNIRQYFLEWQQIFLNNLALNTAKPLYSQLRAKSAEIRELASNITVLKIQLEHPQSAKARENLESMLNEKGKREVACIKEREVLIDKFGDCIGLEHFMREISDSFEAFSYLNEEIASQSMNYISLPSLAASMLLNGIPIEILNGDSKVVPIKWVDQVLQAVNQLLGHDARIYVISVLGIQSSGKSTLLNSLFGVRFAVSAGRCTRGAFLQLLPVSMSLRKDINCDYIAIVDTEGLRAPEKREYRNAIAQDNELATFALCVSDLTLINIGGQTMGEDMTNVLQIAAHAFIRMKEVDLNAECRIIQQFVADVNAEEKNEAAMHSIVSALDDAMQEAAINEGKSHLYRQFSDVFVVQNYDKEYDTTQYIPSLWRGFMAVPNYQYGVNIQKLKASILECIKRSDTSGCISDFISRMTDVWNAVGKEDFVFNFQNTKEANLYEQFMSAYRNLITPVRRDVIGMQIRARKKIEDSKVGETQRVLKECMEEIQQLLADKCGCVINRMSELLKEAKYESVQKHEIYFKLDLQTIQNRILANASADLQYLAHLQEEIMGIDNIVKNISDNLRQHMATVAVELRSRISTNAQLGKQEKKLDRFIQKEFEKIWSGSYESLEKKYPCRTINDILRQNERSLLGSITTETQNTSLMMKEYLTKPLSTYAVSSNEVVEDFDAVNTFRSALIAIDPALNQQFQRLVHDIEHLAKDTDGFRGNAVESVIKLEKFLQRTEINVGLFNVILFICTRFSHVVHREQCKKETDILSLTKHANNDFFPQEIVRIDMVADTLYAIAGDVLKGNFTREKMKKHLANRNRESNVNDRWYKKITFWKSDGSNDDSWQEPLQYKLTTFFDDIEKKNKQCFCTEHLMYLYCQYIDKCVNQSRQISKNITIPANRKTCAVYLALQRGITKFTTYSTDYIVWKVSSENYRMRFSAPFDFPQMRDKIDFINKVFIERNSLFSRSYSSFLDSIGVHIQKYINLSPYLPTLQFLDREFLRLLPVVTTEKSHDIHTTVNDIKTNLLMKNLAPFSPNTVLEQISRIIHKSDESVGSTKLTNDERCAIVLHVAAWILPFTAVAQYQFEKQKNVAIQIGNDKKVFRTFFISLCNERKDKITAQAFCDILKVSMREGATACVFPILYDRLTNQQPEFRRKRTFIGHVFLDLFQRDDYQGLINFLHSFEKVGLAWILQRIATLCNERRNSLLHTTYKKCIEDAIHHIISAIVATQERFQRRGVTQFSNWISMFSEQIGGETNLTLNCTQLRSISNYHRVDNFTVFVDECKRIIRNMCPLILKTLRLPPPGDFEKTKLWLLNGPIKFHVFIFDDFKGCKEQCPFCGSVCDEDMSVHEKHISALHYPQGIKGWHNVHSKKLVTSICTSAVESDKRYRIPSSPSDDPEYRPYREYEVDYPMWHIRGLSTSKPTHFWRYLFAKMNEMLAERYTCQKGDLPKAWHHISKTEAVESANTMYHLR